MLEQIKQSRKASRVSLDTTAFDGALSTEDDVQEAIETLDNSITVPFLGDRNISASATSSDGDQASPTGITRTPAFDSLIIVRINGVLAVIGDGVKTGFECWFSGDDGTTARLIKDVEANDKLHWNQSVAGYNLASSDRISFEYGVTIP